MMKTTTLLVFAFCALLTLTASGADTPEVIDRYDVTSQPIFEPGSGWDIRHVHVSPDGRDVAVSATRGGRDGQVRIQDGDREIKLDRGAYVWVEGSGKSPQWDALLSVDWSPDSRRLAYVALKDEKLHVVVDGTDVGSYDYIPGYEVLFSPDSRHYGFVAATLTKQGGLENMRVIVDGVAGDAVDSVQGPAGGPWLHFSRTGGHWLAFVRMGGRTCTLVDGRVGPSFDGTAGDPAFSPDGAHVAYVGVRGDDWFLVEDDVEHGPFAWVGDVVASPTADEFAYCVKEEESGHVVRAGKALTSYKVARMPVFSPDGEHLAYWASQGSEGSCVVVDSTAGPTRISASSPSYLDSGQVKYDAYLDAEGTRRCYVLDGRQLPEMTGSFARLPFSSGSGSLPGLWLCTSPDGARVAYSWRVDEITYKVVVDDREWDGLFWAGVVQWSVDGSRFAFRAIGSEGKSWTVIDGEPGKQYRDTGTPAFSPDGADVAYVATPEKNKEMLVVNGAEGTTWDEILPSDPEFQPDGSFIYYGGKKDTLYRVTLVPRP